MIVSGLGQATTWMVFNVLHNAQSLLSALDIHWLTEKQHHASIPLTEIMFAINCNFQVFIFDRNSFQLQTYTICSCLCELKTLFNIVEAPLKKLLNFDVRVVWWCSVEPLNSQEYKSFEIYAVSIKISMTEYHHWINDLVDYLFLHSSLWGEMSMAFLVTYIFLLFWST